MKKSHFKLVSFLLFSYSRSQNSRLQTLAWTQNLVIGRVPQSSARGEKGVLRRRVPAQITNEQLKNILQRTTDVLSKPHLETRKKTDLEPETGKRTWGADQKVRSQLSSKAQPEVNRETRNLKDKQNPESSMIIQLT